jgi:hypothetical protein
MTVLLYRSINEVKKPQRDRVHHNNNQCAAWYQIPAKEKVRTTGGYRLCQRCKDLNAAARK